MGLYETSNADTSTSQQLTRSTEERLRAVCTVQATSNNTVFPNCLLSGSCIRRANIAKIVRGTQNISTSTGVLISPYNKLLPDVFCLMMRIFF
jgi:hypothetical protein